MSKYSKKYQNNAKIIVQNSTHTQIFNRNYTFIKNYKLIYLKAFRNL